jgi:hypothetical protein
MYDYSKLRGRITEKYGTISAFADAQESSLTNISNKLNEKTDISRDDIMRWSRMLDIPSSEYGLYFFTLKV